MISKIYKAFTLILFSALSISAFAQDDNKKLAQDFVDLGDEIYYVQKALIIARETYIQATQFDPDNIKANYMAGLVILETINRGEAAQYFEKVYELDPDYRFDILYNIGLGYHYAEEFEKAIEYYNRYIDKLLANSTYRGNDRVSLKDVERRIFECENGIEYKNNPGNVKIVNLGPNINSDSYDYAPVLNADETLLVFTSRRKEGNLNEDVFSDNFPYEDIYISRKSGGNWAPAKNIGAPVNTKFFDSNLALSADGKTLFIYKDDNGGDIFTSELKPDNTWTAPKPLSDNINSSYNENSVSISPDGKILFFSSDRPGGYGGFDIYMARKDDKGVWGRTQNLGPTINTEYDEQSPFIDYDGKTLYFSSKGHKGMGGYDIYKTEYDSLEKKWTEPINLGYPVNSPDDDVFFVATKDGKRGYYATVRPEGLGFLDIYMLTIPDLDGSNADELKARKAREEEEERLRRERELAKVEVPEEKQEPQVTPREEPRQERVLQPVIFTLTVKGKDNNQNMDANISFRAMGEGPMLSGTKLGTGQYRYEFKEESGAQYTLSVEKQGYVFKTVNITIPAAGVNVQNINRTIDLDRVSIGVGGILRNIYFDFDQTTLKQSSFSELDKLETMMLQNPNIRVEIAGHTDNIGTKEYNKSLSLKRAEAVANYLKGKGIDTSRIMTVGYGQERPLASNDDEKSGRELNRRVEFKIIQ